MKWPNRPNVFQLKVELCHHGWKTIKDLVMCSLILPISYKTEEVRFFLRPIAQAVIVAHVGSRNLKESHFLTFVRKGPNPDVSELFFLLRLYILYYDVAVGLVNGKDREGQDLSSSSSSSLNPHPQPIQQLSFMSKTTKSGPSTIQS